MTAQRRHTIAGLAAASLLLTPLAALAFGGEDILAGNPWHHEDITIRALYGPVWFDQTGTPAASECPRNPRPIIGGPDYKTAGFSLEAACSIAWHADYLDSYLYNPLFWAPGGKGRFEAALVGHTELVKLHFDDTFSTAGLIDTWQRYAIGTVVGLAWAAEKNDVAAAQNVLGASVHAIQDFYSHSNWADDPDRRCATFLQAGPDKRTAASLYTGSYELPAAGAPKAHGAYSIACSLVRGANIDKLLEPVCASRLSPFQNTSVCEEWRVCSGSVGVTVSINGKQPENVVRLDPPGIALDTTWLSRVQAANRGLIDVSGNFTAAARAQRLATPVCKAIINADRIGAARPDVCTSDADQLFATVKDLAIRATIEWIEYLDAAMAQLGQGAFWQRVKTEGTPQALREAQYEDLARLPYQFLSAGPYPVGNPSTPEHPSVPSAAGWYLRLQVNTADTLNAGTDADIFAELSGPDFATTLVRLDNLPTSDPGWRNYRLLAHDDFKRGDRAVYTIGPFAGRPQSLRLVNRSASAGDIAAGLLNDIADSVDASLVTLRQGLISVVAGNADYVGTNKQYLTGRALKARLDDSRNGRSGERDRFAATFDGELLVNGGNEGIHNFKYRVREVPNLLTEAERRDGWLAVEVRAFSLQTKTASMDRLTGGDEPFVVFMASPFNGRREAAGVFLSDPLPSSPSDSPPRAFSPGPTNLFNLKIPPWGGLGLAVAVFEQDLETEADRISLRDTFRSAMDDAQRAPAARFLDAVGRAAGGDWTVAGVEAYGFKRGENAELARVLTLSDVGRIKADEATAAFPLDWGGARSLPAPPLASWQTAMADRSACTIATVTIDNSGAATLDDLIAPFAPLSEEELRELEEGSKFR